MAPIFCDVCSKIFSEAKNIPKILPCGHTFCHVCIDNLFDVCDCPTCKQVFSQHYDFPTNFLVLKQIEVQDKPLFSGSQDKASCSCSQMESKLKNIEKELLKRKDMLVKHIVEKTTFKNLIRNGITKLEQMLEMDVDIRNSTEVEKLIVELEDDLRKVDAVLYFCDKTELKPTYSLKEYMNSSFFLNDIAVRLHKSEEMYAYEVVENSKLKYGKIVLMKDRINIHSLTLSEVEKPSSLVAFQDLRKCITAEKAKEFRTFIKIGEETLSFSITDSSFLASRFVKLCSGENGPTFKGASLEKGSYYGLLIKKYVLNDVESEDFSDYDFTIFCDAKETKCYVGQFVVQMNSNGSCEIINFFNRGANTLKNIVAVSEQNTGNLKCNTTVIKDCGISLVF